MTGRVAEVEDSAVWPGKGLLRLRRDVVVRVLLRSKKAVGQCWVAEAPRN